MNGGGGAGWGLGVRHLSVTLVSSLLLQGLWWVLPKCLLKRFINSSHTCLLALAGFVPGLGVGDETQKDLTLVNQLPLVARKLLEGRSCF